MKDKNNLSRVGFDSRSVRDWIGYCLSLPGEWKLITSLLLLLTLGIGQVWGIDYEANYGWESGTADGWGKNSATAITVRNTGARTGTYCIDLEANSSSSSMKLSSVTFTKGLYHHVILYAKTNSSTATIQVNLNGNNPGNSTPGTSWTRITHAYNYGSSTGNKNIEIKFPSATNNAHVHGYFDDVVFYTSSSNTTDITSPNAPTAGDITKNKLKWTNGDDSGTGATGRQATLIWKWKNNGGNGADLTLNNQGKYVVPATGSTLDQSEHWELVSATVDKDATEYEGTFAEGAKYAIVHRDLAYNYSSPAYVTIPTSGGGDTEAPTLSSSNPTNNATNVAVSGNIVLTFSENVTINDASKFTIYPSTGVTLSTPTVSGAAVTIPYSGLANNTQYTLSIAADAVKDAANNKNAAVSGGVTFTTVAATPVATAPSFTSPASEPGAAEYTVGATISALEVEATGYPEPTLQWYSNSSKSTEGATLLTGKESASYTPSNAAASDLYYYCVATNASGSVNSHYFHVTVAAPEEKAGIKMVENGAWTGKFRIKSDQFKSLSGSNKYTIEGLDYTKYVEFGSSATGFGSEDEGVNVKNLYYAPSKKNIKFWFYVQNNESSNKNLYVYVFEEGKSPTTTTIQVASGASLVSQEVTIDNNAEIAFFSNSTKVLLCQVVAAESGNALKQGGEVGYMVDYSKKRLSVKAETPRVVDGIEYKLAANAKLNSSSNVQLTTLGTHYIKFHLDALTKVSIECDNKPYKIGTSSSGNAAQIYSGQDDGAFNLTQGDWYINGAGQTVKITKLSFLEPDVMRTITLKYADDVTADGSLLVVDGTKATKPADPTWAHHRFDGWYNGENAYDWTANVIGDLELTAHWTQLYTISFAAGDGSGDAPAAVADKAQGETFSVPENTYDAPNDKVFAGWNDGTNDYAPGDTYTVGTSNVTLTAQWVANSYEAKIGTTMYATLADAVAAANAAGGAQEITLLKDCDVTAQLEINAGVDVTIDLAGKKIEYKGTETLPSGVLLVHNGASLTINDSSEPDAGSIVSGNKAYAAIALTKAGDDATNPATLTVNGGNLYGYYYAITGNGARHNTVITINNCVITTSDEGLGIFHPQQGTLTINNATITGHDAAIEMRAGTLVINDGTFTATATAYSIAPNGSGSTTVGAALAIAQHTTQKPVSVTINGGTFNGVKAINEANPQGNPAPEIAMEVKGGDFTGEVSTTDVDHFVSGGTFNHAVAADQCAENYAPKDNGDGTYGVKPLATTIDIEGYYVTGSHGTVAEALAAHNYTLTADMSDNNKVSWDNNSNAYDKGLKIKEDAKTFSFDVAAGKLVTFKTGIISGATMSVNGGTAENLTITTKENASIKTRYYYNAEAQHFVFTTTTASYNIIKLVKIEDPYVVTYNATDGTCATTSAMYIGEELTLPTPTHATYSFKGWYDAAEGGNPIGAAGANYTPTANITLYAQWETVSTVNTLSDLQVDGATIDGFDPATNIYYLVYEYGQQPEITSATATAGDLAEVTINNTPVHYQDATEDFWYVQVKVVPQSGDNDKKFYQVRYTNRPKKGVELIKVMIPNGTGNAQNIDAANITGYIGGTANQKLESGKHKLGSGGHYIGITLAEGTFQENDLVNVNIETVTGDKLRVFSENTAAEAKVVAQSAANMFAGVNTVVLGETTTNSLYLRRGTNDENYQKSWNPFVGYISVERYMDAFIEEFKIGDVNGTINGTNISIELPYNTDLTGVAATVKAWANGGATVTAPTALAYNTPLEYTVNSAYPAEDAAVVYTVTITEAAAIKEVVVSGTLAVLEGENTTLSAVVYDTNDQEAAIQTVTWSVKAGDEALASITSAGVVTGLSVGTAHIIATSAADNTKYAEVEVVVSENPCRAWSNPSSKETGATIGKMVVTPTGLGTLQTNMTPYQGAEATNAWKLDSKDSRYAEIKFTDNAQFESLLLGVSSKDNDKNYKFAVVCSSAAGNGFADGVLSATTYEAVDQDEAENLVDVELPTGTKAVRVYREYTNGSSTIGGGSSVFLYYIRACEKDFVPVTAVNVSDANLAIGASLTLYATLTPANADIETYTWSIESMTATGVTIDGNVLTAAANATEGEVVVKVIATDVLSNSVNATATISIVNHFDAITSVNETTTWSWETLTVPSGNGPKIAENDTVLANYLSGAQWEKIAGKYNEYVWRSDSYKCYQGTKLNIVTTVPGVLSIKARRQDSGDKLYVNGEKIADLTTDQTTYSVAVPAGEVKITGNPGMRIYAMTFKTLDEVTPDYTRNVTIDRMGTVCVDHNVPAGCIVGAEVYKLLYWKYGTSYQDCQMVDFEQVNEMKAGEPYMIIPTETVFKLYYGAEKVDAPKHMPNGFIGTFDPIAQADDNVLVGKYGVVNNQIRLLGPGAYSPANRAYIDLSETPSKEEYEAQNPNPAPARRISLGRQGEQVATGLDAINVDVEKVEKIMIDGQMYILRGGHVFDATGRLVK